MPHRLSLRERIHKRWPHAVSGGLLLALIVACTTGPDRATDPALQVDARARELVAQGQPAAAAAEYLRLADRAPAPDAARYRVAAADALLAAGDLDRAREVLAHPAVTQGDTAARARRAVLLARMHLLEGDATAAAAELAAVDFDRAEPDVAREGRALHARVLEDTGDYRGATEQRVALELLLTEPQAIEENRRRLWDRLSSLSREQLAPMRQPPPDTAGGWVELALLRDRHLFDPVALETALSVWSRSFPGHPANHAVVADLRANSRTLGTPARHIALLLPLSGEYADAAVAIRDGFLASWFSRAPASDRPSLLIYDTEGADMAALYARAVSAGADFVVGPLRKEAVAAVVAAGPTVPTLALNVADPGPPAGPGLVYQFALSPEGEAEQVAEKVRLDGHAHALMLIPDSEWGERVEVAFRNRWSGLGGTVSGAARYGSEPDALADTVRRLLNIDRSEARAQQLRSVIGTKIEHEPRRRQDVDAIFLAGFPRQARQLRPQIDFHRASRVPVYATSHVFSGRPDPNADGDINGIVFGDMPWVIGTVGADQDLRERLFAAWPAAAGAFTRFYAFGADAYRLVDDIGRLRAHPDATLQGLTGRLSLDPDNRVRRRLVWAIFDRGVPKPLTPADE